LPGSTKIDWNYSEMSGVQSRTERQCRSGDLPGNGGHHDALCNSRRQRDGAYLTAGDNFGRPAGGPVDRRYRGKRIIESRADRDWNRLPGATKLAKFKDRKAAAQRLWAAFAELPVEPERVAGSPAPRAGSKQAQAI